MGIPAASFWPSGKTGGCGHICEDWNGRYVAANSELDAIQ